VLVQTNYGHTHDLQIGGVPIGKLLLKDKKMEEEKTEKSLSGKADEGSIVIILMCALALSPTCILSTG
jgi:D-aminopeptidase